MVWHVLTLGAMATCGWLAVWQWQRAGSAMGSAVNIGYGLQWPVFAIFFGVMWWRMLRMEVRRIDGLDTDEVASDASTPAVDEEAPPVAARSGAPVAGEDGLPAPRAPDASSPFGVRRTPVPAVTDAEDPELAAYNRMLAGLATRDEDARA